MEKQEKIDTIEQIVVQSGLPFIDYNGETIHDVIEFDFQDREWIVEYIYKNGVECSSEKIVWDQTDEEENPFDMVVIPYSELSDKTLVQILKYLISCRVGVRMSNPIVLNGDMAQSHFDDCQNDWMDPNPDLPW